MGTMNGLMDAARSSLANAQTALNITAANIANQNTVGYARRTVVFTENDTVQIGGVAQGRGAAISVIAQRDRILDQRVQNETQTQAAAEARLTGLQSVESIFALNNAGSDSAGIGDAISGLFNAFRSLQAGPSSASTRQSVLNAAQTFVDAIHGVATGLASVQASLQAQVSNALSTVNTLTAQLAAVNEQITAAGSSAGPSLEDQRQNLLTSLSSLIGFNQITGDNGSISLALADGTPLVSGTVAHTLSSANVDGALQVTSDAGIDVTASIMGGSIGGSLQVANDDIPAVLSSLDQLVYSIASAINLDNSNGLTPSGAAGSNLFNLPATATGAAMNITLAASDPSAIAAAAAGEGSSGGSNAAAISELSNSAIVLGKTPSSFLASMLTELGGTVQSATNISATASDSLTQATTQRDALSGVSLDEEAANLTQYQRSYQAAAKIFAIVNELMANSINLGTDVAVS